MILSTKSFVLFGPLFYFVLALQRVCPNKLKPGPRSSGLPRYERRKESEVAYRNVAQMAQDRIELGHAVRQLAEAIAQSIYPHAADLTSTMLEQVEAAQTAVDRKLDEICN